MSEATPAVVEAQDPFNGQSPSFEEFSKYRETGEVPERFKPAATEPKSEAPKEEAKTAEVTEPSTSEQEAPKQEREQDGKFKAKEKEPLFSADQQKAFDNAFKKREAKLRREYEERIAAIESKMSQGTAPAKEPSKEAAASSEPQPPEIPDITTFAGSADEFQKALKDYPAKFAAYLDAKREVEQTRKAIASKVEASAKAVMKEFPDFEDVDAQFRADIQAGDEPAMPNHLFKAIVEDTDDPQRIMYHLQTNREEYRRLAELAPNQALKEVLKLEFKLQREKESAKAAKPAQEPKPRQTSAPPPPEPVGARATAKAFDVNDESVSADEWAKKRAETAPAHIFGRRR